jgi:hypothetical protein
MRSIFIVERSYPYSDESADELCICGSHERAVEEIEKEIERPEYNGADVLMPKKIWTRKSQNSWHHKDRHEEWITIREVEVLE